MLEIQAAKSLHLIEVNDKIDEVIVDGKVCFSVSAESISCCVFDGSSVRSPELECPVGGSPIFSVAAGNNVISSR